MATLADVSISEAHETVRPHVLVLDAVALSYGTASRPIVALSELSLGIGCGEFVSILGPSGCGKSTLLKIVAGLLKPTSGSVTLAGEAVAGPRHDVGVVFQQPTLLPWKTVLGNVLVPIRCLKRPIKDYRERAVSLLRLVGLVDFLDNYPHELSGGMQQRVGIARGLIHDPSILLMDEPFAALDALSREAMMKELQRIWWGTGKSVLFITHSIPEAVFLSDRVVTLSPRPGRVIDSVSIDIERPRRLDVMRSQSFADYCHGLRMLLDRGATEELAG